MNAHPAITKSDDLRSSLRTLLASGFGYLDARLRLARAEASEAASTLATLLFLFLCAALAFAGVYFASMIALTLFVAKAWWSGDLLPSLLIVAGFNATVALTVIAGATLIFRRKTVFRHTIEELNNDRLWLQTPIPPSRS